MAAGLEMSSPRSSRRMQGNTTRGIHQACQGNSRLLRALCRVTIVPKASRGTTLSHSENHWPFASQGGHIRIWSDPSGSHLNEWKSRLTNSEEVINSWNMTPAPRHVPSCSPIRRRAGIRVTSITARTHFPCFNWMTRSVPPAGFCPHHPLRREPPRPRWWLEGTQKSSIRHLRIFCASKAASMISHNL